MFCEGGQYSSTYTIGHISISYCENPRNPSHFSRGFITSPCQSPGTRIACEPDGLLELPGCCRECSSRKRCIFSWRSTTTPGILPDRGRMTTKSLLDDEQTFLLILQLADMASAAHEQGDFTKRDEALEQIRKIREEFGEGST